MRGVRIKRIDWVIVILFLASVYSLLIDLTYQGYIKYRFLTVEVLRIEKLLINMGFNRIRALDLLKSSLGITVTMVTFILNMGINIFDHSERKVFGISWGDLQSERKLMPGWSGKIASILFPVTVIVTINLELCGISYMLLVWCYYAIYCKYRNLTESYDKGAQREKVANKLIGFVKNDKYYISDNITYFCAELENVRKGIRDTEGWNNAWLLFDIFLDKVIRFQPEACFEVSGYFFEVIFEVSDRRNVRQELVFVNRYIGQMGKEDERNNEETLLWSLFCSITMKWYPETM